MADRPNILLLMTDQQRWDTIAALGNGVIRTPAIDGLVRRGASFDRCYTPSLVCLPARAALACGLPPHRTGVTDNMRGWATEPAVTIMQHLTDAGYRTHGVGKMHFHPDSYALWGFESREAGEEGGANPQRDAYCRYLLDQGYGYLAASMGARSEYYYIPQMSQVAPEHHNSTWTADRSIAFLRERPKDRPFFLWTSFVRPHPPFETPPPWCHLYRAREMAEPFRPDGYEDLLTYWNHAQNRYKHRGEGYDAMLMRTIRAAYYASISHIDYNIGRILEALGDEADNTLILFTADHGELLGDYGSVGKRCMLDAAARVPMVACWPGRIGAGGRYGGAANLLDLFPTFADAAGLDVPAPCEESASLLRLLDQPQPDRVVFSQFYDGRDALYMAASRHAKFIYAATDNRAFGFDLLADPRETRSNADLPAVRALERTLIERFQRDGYAAPLDGDRWRCFEPRTVSDDPLDGLLYQDRHDLQDRIDALGPGYARPVTVPPRESYKLLTPSEGGPDWAK